MMPSPLIRVGFWARPAAAILTAGLVLSAHASAYVLNSVTWSQRPVAYSVNPTNLDLPTAAIDPAVRAGADVWATQSNASFSFTFTGDSTQTTTGYDGLNLVVFRNASSGSAIATTYWWSSGSAILDADVVFWDQAFRFFTGSTGCSAGFYIEDIAAHEFGHALGLGHSTSPSATMYPSVAYCDMTNRTLDADDIAGVTALYPPMSLPAAPTGVRIIPPWH
jgi:matrix metalloproteinase-20 (enamelysin)